jgi:methylated-DNA-[protein]-cysteine S-methyltransferase
MERCYYHEMPSPIGTLTLLSDGTHITAVHMRTFEEVSARWRHDWVESARHLGEARAQLEAYFAGKLREFSLPLRPRGTAFQRRVWSALEGIPYAATSSYGEIAARIGSAGSARAVGAANGRNPIAIVVPCHRVIGANGALVGYGGGLERKTWLLQHEERFGARQLSLV